MTPQERKAKIEEFKNIPFSAKNYYRDAIFRLGKEIIESLEAENERLRNAFSPRLWTKGMSEAWHKAIPYTQSAFEKLLSALDKGG